MDTKGLLHSLGYAESDHFIRPENFADYPGYSFLFRRAEEKCGLQGVYALTDPKENASSLTPVVYVCEARDQQQAAEIHKKVWNQNSVPFLLVTTPKDYRLYRGFQFKAGKAGHQEQAIEIVRDANKVIKSLQDLKADSIDSGRVWQTRAKDVTTGDRVDGKLLKHLKELGDMLRGGGLSRRSSHGLIGKYVYLRYLRDRDILSNRRLSEWGLNPAQVFSRKATLSGFNELNRRLDKRLNGSVFPLPTGFQTEIKASHIKDVAGVFHGDEPDGTQHFDEFEAYDFSHIPIETLSVVYQQFLHAEEKGRGKGAYYTPIHLVNLMLDTLEERKPLANGMTILDPSCGSGAFLVQCYRRLIERELSANGDKLNPTDLRLILMNQIFGIDLDEDACCITELSLIPTYSCPPSYKVINGSEGRFRSVGVAEWASTGEFGQTSP
jgi:hypothetical protein